MSEARTTNGDNYERETRIRDAYAKKPAHPPLENYDALGMKDAHDATQSDFRNAKERNLADYATYNLGAKIDKKTGKPKRIELKTGEDVVSSQAQNTNANIDAVAAKILSSAWTELQSHENA